MHSKSDSVCFPNYSVACMNLHHGMLTSHYIIKSYLIYSDKVDYCMSTEQTIGRKEVTHICFVLIAISISWLVWEESSYHSGSVHLIIQAGESKYKL